MTEEEIRANNRTIAEYMGYIHYHKGININDDFCGGMYTRTEIFSKVPIMAICSKDDADDCYFADLPNPDFGKTDGKREWRDDLETLGWDSLNSRLYIIDLNYHASWDWLMPVILKIGKMGHKYEIYEDSCDIHYLPHEKPNLIDCITCQFYDGNQLKAIYEAIIEFIKWYNSQNK